MSGRRPRDLHGATQFHGLPGRETDAVATQAFRARGRRQYNAGRSEELAACTIEIIRMMIVAERIASMAGRSSG